MYPVMLQATQAPLQVVLQHTPSTQLPEVHSQLVLQVAPFVFLPVQVVPEQYAALPSHCVLEQAPEQLELQAPAPLQPYSPHPPSGSVPAVWLRQVPT